MIIQCESCETQFRLDETRIPQDGTRVRCSRCKAAFFVPHPANPGPDVTEDVVAEATEPPPQAADPSDDRNMFAAEGSDLSGSAPATAGSAPDLDPDDEQWQFEDEIDVPPPPPAAAPAEPEAPDLFGPDLSAPEAPPAAFSEPEPEAPASDPMDDFELDLNEGSLDLGSERAANEAPAAGLDLESPPQAGVGFELDEAGIDPMAAPDPPDVPHPPPSPSLPSLPAAESQEEIGPPEDWDFLSDSSEALAKNAEFSDEAEPAVAAASAIEDDDLFPDEDLEQASAAVMADAAASGSTRSSTGGRFSLPSFAVGNSIGWFVGVALLLVGFSQALVPAPPRGLSVAEPRTFSLPLGEAREVRGRFVDNAWTGPLFVVHGHYQPTETPRGPVKLSLRWLDAEGHPLPSVPDAVAGAGLEPDELRELRPQAVAQLLSRASPDFRLGGAFHVVPGTVPEGAADFDLVFQKLRVRRVAPPAAPADEAGSDESLDPPAEATEAPVQPAEATGEGSDPSEKAAPEG